MPSSLLHPCGATGCSVLIPGSSSRCSLHRNTVTYGHTPRIRGRKLQALRLDLYAAEPYCRGCGQLLTMLPRRFNSMVRDHVIPLNEGGTDDPKNVQPLCPSCDEKKTNDDLSRAAQKQYA